MIQSNLTKEIIKSVVLVSVLIIVVAYLTYLILSNIMGEKTTSFYTKGDLIIEIQETLRKEISTTLDNDYRKILVTNNGKDTKTYQIVMSSNSNLDDTLVVVDNRVKNIEFLNKKGNDYIIAEFDLESRVTNQTMVNIYLDKGRNRNVEVKFKVIEKEV